MLWQFRVLVACIFLNRTRGDIADPYITSFFEEYPTVETVRDAEPLELLERYFQPLGKHRRACGLWTWPAHSWKILHGRWCLGAKLANSTPIFPKSLTYQESASMPATHGDSSAGKTSTPTMVCVLQSNGRACARTTGSCTDMCSASGERLLLLLLPHRLIP